MESLPNEILLKIIKMAAKSPKMKVTKLGEIHYDHRFLIHVVRKISTRFKRLSRLPEFWREIVVVSLNNIRQPQLQSVEYQEIKDLLSSEIKYLVIKGDGNQTVDILDLSTRCQNLERLEMRCVRTGQWPFFISPPWDSLRFLHLDVLESPSDGIGQMHQMNQIMPNLVELRISSLKAPMQIVLPWINGCKNLRKVVLQDGVFCFTADQWATCPLPRSLRKFCVIGALVTYDREVIPQDEFGSLMRRSFHAQYGPGWYCKITLERYGVMDLFQDYVPDTYSDSEADNENDDQNHIPQKAI